MGEAREARQRTPDAASLTTARTTTCCGSFGLLGTFPRVLLYFRRSLALGCRQDQEDRQGKDDPVTEREIPFSI